MAAWETKSCAKKKPKGIYDSRFSSSNNPRKLWKTLKRVVPTKPASSMLSFIEVNGHQISDPTAIANAFNEYFFESQTSTTPISCIDENGQDLIKQRLQNFVNDRIDESTDFFIPEISRNQVEQDFAKIASNKATGIDAIGIRVLKMALPAIAPSLTHIYNASITTGSYPVKFKQAKLCPIYKKKSVHERNNYRPISVLSIISKPLERHVATSYLEYLNSHRLLYRHQSAYRPYHSCETALLNLTDNWLNAMDKSNLVGVILLDLSKGFDLVDHDTLLSKISAYHASAVSMKWFESYLWERSQICSVARSLSAPLTLSCGVPQGSLLGPVLFSLYMNDLPLNIPEANVDAYADDTTLWKSNGDCIKIQNDLQSSLDCANVWFKQNHMKPNITKTKLNIYSLALTRSCDMQIYLLWNLT